MLALPGYLALFVATKEGPAVLFRLLAGQQDSAEAAFEVRSVQLVCVCGVRVCDLF